MGYHKEQHDLFAKKLDRWTIAASVFSAVSGPIFLGLAFDVLPELPVTDDQLATAGWFAFTGLAWSIFFTALNESTKRMYARLGDI